MLRHSAIGISGRRRIGRKRSRCIPGSVRDADANFTAKLRELTVHHRDHNHGNNPPDGSNWELLCLYCHDNEHARHQVADAYGEAMLREEREPPSTYRPFADLADLLQRKT